MSDNKICAVIMCGGSGTRFWPASRTSLPKQFLKLDADLSLIQETVARLEGLVPVERVFLLAAANHRENLQRHLPDVPEDNYILEPEARNTAPALALAAKRIQALGEDFIIAALPSDHAITNKKGFRDTLRIASQHAAQHDTIVTLGIKPDRPETGYGYIDLGESVTPDVKRIQRFVEKPDLETAKEYLAAGHYVWNAGIFVVRTGALIDAFKQHDPKTYKHLWEKLPSWNDAGFHSNLAAEYEKLQKVSIDYAIMENMEEAACVPAKFDWNDLGSWLALEEYWGTDGHDNASNATYYSIDSNNNIISTGGRDIALIGVDDLIVVERNDVVMICHKDRSQDVKKMVDMLKKEGRDDLL